MNFLSHAILIGGLERFGPGCFKIPHFGDPGHSVLSNGTRLH